MIKNILFCGLLCLLFGIVPGHAQRLEKFIAKTGHYSRNGSVLHVVYPETRSYYGFLNPEKKTNSLKSKYFIFLIVREDIQEIGFRVISPVPDLNFPNKGDLVSDDYTMNEKEKKLFFDPAIRIFQTDNLNVGDEIKIKPEEIKWKLVAENDNNIELHAQPSGKKNNALVRMYDKKNPELKIVKAGIYKIEIDGAPVDMIPANGSFLLQVGCKSEIPVLKISEKSEDL